MKKILRWFSENLLVMIMWGVILGSMLVGGLREYTDLEIAWWPFGDSGSGQCYYMGNVEICDCVFVCK